jgi:ABC-2 type transport system ATP-binding protein
LAFCKRYGRTPALDDVSLRVAAGEAVAMVGENGSGKTTLMRVCAGVLRQDAGSVTVAGRVGYCPQEPALLDLLSADEHLGMILFGAALGLPAREALEQGRELLADLRFPAGDPTRAGELSGGSRQKLNLALALLADPPRSCSWTSPTRASTRAAT